MWRSTARPASTASTTRPSLTRFEHAIVVVDLEPDADPPPVLAIGPDRAGNLLEIIWLEFEDDPPIVIHAMTLRHAFHSLLPTGEDD